MANDRALRRPLTDYSRLPRYDGTGAYWENRVRPPTDTLPLNPFPELERRSSVLGGSGGLEQVLMLSMFLRGEDDEDDDEPRTRVVYLQPPPAPYAGLGNYPGGGRG